MLKEANAISSELRKNVTFQFTLLSDTCYSPLPLAVASGNHINTVHVHRLVEMYIYVYV